MADIKGFVNLDYIVSSYILGSDEDHRFYEKYMQFAINGVSELKRFALPSIKVAYLDIEDNNTAKLPRDYVDYILIGVELNGKIYTLTRKDSIVLPIEESCGEFVRDNIGSGDVNLVEQGAYPFINHINGGVEVDNLFSVGGGFNEGYYRIDLENNQIVLLLNGSVSKNRIIMEYKSSGVNSNTIIPRDCVNYLTSYIHFKKHEFKANLNLKMEARNSMNIAYKKMYAARNSFTIDEYLDTKAECYKQSLKG